MRKGRQAPWPEYDGVGAPKYSRPGDWLRNNEEMMRGPRCGCAEVEIAFFFMCKGTPRIIWC